MSLVAQRHVCRPTYLEGENLRHPLLMDHWWDTIGQHSDYFRVRLHDIGSDLMQDIQSPCFRRDDPRAAAAALGSVMSYAARALTRHFTPELAPQ